MISLLLDNGADLNATNKDGRTALMEVFWGQLAIVQILPAKGAAENQWDKGNKTALDLARLTPRNRKERFARRRKSFDPPFPELFREKDFIVRAEERREIARILGGNEDDCMEGCHSTSIEPVKNFFVRLSEGLTVGRCAVTRVYSLGQTNRSIAVLERGGLFPTVTAMSGWHHEEDDLLTNKVLTLAALVGHILIACDMDFNQPGRHQASHAEKKMVAYFVDRHVFLPEGKTADGNGEDGRLCRVPAKGQRILWVINLAL
ncbi:hypothetical protein BDW74DRAFT_4502 [Aspergillus multicolor]|uniref:ankyrin repeat domain-containing protein n=1 Tax=Aspergillus multicolor TaxID=41759 RepID=UPI003CCD54A3